jgi:N6-adenosine-specific RNA methylase IME4
MTPAACTPPLLTAPLLTARPPFGRLPLHGYDAIYADPPTGFETWSAAGQGRSPQRHYPVMSWDDLQAMPVADLARRDCLLFLWACWPTLRQSMDLLEAWGFRYSTGGSWHKLTRRRRLARGPGMRLMSASEPWLLGVRGAPRTRRGLLNAFETLDEGWLDIRARRRQHSRKPVEARQRIEDLCPDAVKVELFAREPAPGWDAWGNEIARFAGAA